MTRGRAGRRGRSAALANRRQRLAPRRAPRRGRQRAGSRRWHRRAPCEPVARRPGEAPATSTRRRRRRRLARASRTRSAAASTIANAISSERPEGTSRASVEAIAGRCALGAVRGNGTTTLAARAPARVARSTRPQSATLTCSPRAVGGPRSAPQASELDPAEQHDLVLELDPELLAGPAARPPPSARGSRRVVAPPAFSMKFACIGEISAPPTPMSLQTAAARASAPPRPRPAGSSRPSRTCASSSAASTSGARRDRRPRL